MPSNINTDSNFNEHKEEAVASAYEKKRVIRKLGEAAMEGFATFLFMCVIFFNHGDVAKFAFGMWVILCIFGSISGAHINPAITIGFYFVEQDWIYGLVKMSLYVVFQFIGCIGGIFLGVFIVGEKAFSVLPDVAMNKNGMPVGWPTDFQIFFSEFFFTGTFFFIIAIATHAKYPPTKHAPINCAVIIAWFYCAVKSGASLSGSALNPAVLLALNVTTKIKNHNEVLKKVPYMILGEFLGVIFFALIFKYIYNPMYELSQDEKNKPAEEFVPAKIKEIEQV